MLLRVHFFENYCNKIQKSLPRDVFSCSNSFFSPFKKKAMSARSASCPATFTRRARLVDFFETKTPNKKDFESFSSILNFCFFRCCFPLRYFDLRSRSPNDRSWSWSVDCCWYFFCKSYKTSKCKKVTKTLHKSRNKIQQLCRFFFLSLEIFWNRYWRRPLQRHELHRLPRKIHEWWWNRRRDHDWRDWFF